MLGVLIEDPRPLRLADVGEHPQSYGFPPGHPPMHSFLGVPILIRGQAWGNLYLTEKQGGGEFTEEDEEAATVLAQWAATAIENARLYESSERRRDEAERAVRSLEAARDIADAVGGVPDLERVLELIVKRGRALVDARTVLIMLREGDELVVAASAGHAADARGRRIPIAGSTSGQVLERGRAGADRRRRHASADRASRSSAWRTRTRRCWCRCSTTGRASECSRRSIAASDGGAFTAADEQLLRTFAASAANAVALNRSVEADRLRSAIAAADAERGRWARELHDQTLQALGGLRVLLASALRRGDATANEQAMRQAIEDIEHEIENLRAIITDLRPSLLDDLGLLPAIEALLDRRRQGGLRDHERVGAARPRATAIALAPELETTVYRLVQEALTNVVKHAGATTVRVLVDATDGELIIEVQDDGRRLRHRRADRRASGWRACASACTWPGGTLELSVRRAGDAGPSAASGTRPRREAGWLSADQVAS